MNSPSLLSPAVPYLRSGRRACFLPALILLGLAGLSGCREEEGIQVYDVPKVPDRGIQTVPPGSPGRLIGVLLPTEDATWFFKVYGPDAFVSKHAKAIYDFIVKVRLEGGVPKYDVPAGWREEDGGEPPGAPKRHKTFVIDIGCSPRVEMALSKMNAGQDVAANIQRWRGQLAMDPVSDAEALVDAIPVPTAAGQAQWVDLKGIYSPNLTAPFAGGGMSGSGPGPLGAAGSAGAAGGNLPPGHPPLMPNIIQGPAPVLSHTAPRGSPVKYEAPAEWTPIPPMMYATAAFEFVEGDEKITISISDVGGVLLENVNRWRREQLGLPPIDEGALETAITKMKVGDRNGDYIELFSPAERNTAIFVGMAPGTVGTWFIKLVGDAPLAQRQRATFAKFLSTFKFER